jgi:type III pantothenate kinase
MLLAIDVGNINLKLGLFAEERLLATWRLSNEVRRTSDEYGLLLTGLLARQAGIGPLDAVAVGSVVPRLDPILAEACQNYFDLSPFFLGPGVDFGLPVLTDYPEQVGVDRLADALAGATLHGAPLITIDMGTATCFNAVSREGAFLGGAIAPGLSTIMEGMVRSAAKLPPIPLEAPPAAIGRNTVVAMQSGLVHGYVGLVENIVQRIWAELGRCRVVATGGHCQLVAAQTPLIDIVNPDLTLHGLRLVHERNVGRR